MIDHLKKGELFITEDMANNLINTRLSSIENEHIKSATLFFKEGLIHAKIGIQEKGFFTPKELTAIFSIYDFNFKPQLHNLSFKIEKIKDIKYNSFFMGILEDLTSVIITTLMQRKLNLENIVTCNGDIITCHFDNIDVFQELVNKEVTLRGFKIKPYNHVTIKSIVVANEKIIVTPRVKLFTL